MLCCVKPAEKKGDLCFLRGFTLPLILCGLEALRIALPLSQTFLHKRHNASKKWLGVAVKALNNISFMRWLGEGEVSCSFTALMVKNLLDYALT